MLKLKEIIKKNWDFILFTVIIICILSPFIYQNGYFLSIDYISGPSIDLVYGQYYPNYILWIYIQKFFSYFLGVILTQKLFIIGFFFISFFSIKKLLLIFFKNKIIIFIGGLFFILNPFVYPRLIQGQFFILYAYSLLPFIFYFLFEKKYILLAIFTSIIIGFSPHFIFLIFIIFFIYFLYFFKEISKNIKIKEIYFGIIIFLVFNLYWIIRIKTDTNILNFGNDFYYFSSKNIYFENIYFEIFSLNGFWGDQFGRYIIKKGFLNYIFFSTIIILSIIGIINFKKENNKKLYFFISLFFISFILSIGVSENNIFKNLSLFLYNNLPFYSGIRESNKFSAILVIIYILLFLKGLDSIKNNNINFLIIFIILFSSWSTSLIFQKQIKAYNYPNSWYEIKNTLENKNKNNSKILILPWHQSMSFSFTKNHLIMNPSGLFFGKNALIGDNIEMLDIYSQSSRKESIILEKYFKEIKNKKIDLISFLNDLKNLKIKFIILQKELDFLEYKKNIELLNLKILKENKEVILYEIDK